MQVYSDTMAGCKTSPQRSIKWVPHPAANGCQCDGMLEICCCKGTKKYMVTEFPTNWDGRAFTLAKFDGSEMYRVFVAPNPQDHQCDCAGFAYGRGKACRHIEAMRVVLGNGWMPHPCDRAEQDAGSTELEDAPF